MGPLVATWPNDADGDVFRRLAEHGFDFSKSHTIDFNVDFDGWPPSPKAVELLRSTYGDIKLYEPDDLGNGYALFNIYGPVTYETVTAVQRRVTTAMQPFGGRCESWGVLQYTP